MAVKHENSSGLPATRVTRWAICGAIGALALGCGDEMDAGMDAVAPDCLAPGCADTPEPPTFEALPGSGQPAAEPARADPWVVWNNAAAVEAPDIIEIERRGAPIAVDGHRSGGARLWDGRLELDGSDGQVAIPAPGEAPPEVLSELNAGSIALWVRYDGIENDGETVDVLPLLYYGRTDARTRELNAMDALTVYVGHGDIEDPNRRAIYFTVLKLRDVVLCFDSGAISLEPGRWYHYTVTVAPGGDHHGYLDGSSSSGTTTPRVPTGTASSRPSTSLSAWTSATASSAPPTPTAGGTSTAG
jgi:hypothetical protein